MSEELAEGGAESEVVSDVSSDEGVSEENRSLADIIDSAFDKVDNGAEEQSQEASQQSAQPADGGQINQKQAQEVDPQAAVNQPDFTVAPERLSAEAKAAWEQAPDALKADVHRTINEMTQGIEKYRDDASKWDNIRDFEQMAASAGTDVRTAISNYVAAEQLLSRDIVGGMTQLAQQFGYDFREIAAHVMGEQYQASAESDTVRSLQAQVQQLTQQLGGFQQQQQATRQEKINADIETFKAENPRFEELSSEIADMLRTGYATDLKDAYQKAEKLSPLPAAPGADLAVNSDPMAQTQKGRTTPTGAPNSGSNPKNRGPAASARSALDRAFETVGI